MKANSVSAYFNIREAQIGSKGCKVVNMGKEKIL